MRRTVHSHSTLKFDPRRGSQLVEAGLVLLPLFALLFIAMDAAWAAFVKATLEHAVREGVRYAVTGQTSGQSGQVASIEAFVKDRALGLLDGDQAGTLSVEFLDPVTLTQATIAPVNQGGNLVTVSVTNYSVTPLAPLLRSNDPLSITVNAADKIEPSPGGIPPTL